MAQDPDISGGVDRRAFLGGTVAAAVTTVSGCSSSRTDSGQTAPTDAASDEISEPDQNADIGVRDAVEAIYEDIGELPIVTNNRFVFDVKFFEDEFDREGLRAKSDEVSKTLESMAERDESDVDIDRLTAIVDLASLLIRQRAIVHQIITAALTCEQRFSRRELEGSITAIRDARDFVVDLKRNGEQIEKTVPRDEYVGPSIEGFDSESVQETQDVLVDIAQWTNPAYDGIHQMLQGIARFDDGTTALEEDRFGTAETAYENARSLFEEAEKGFDRAQASGRRLPHVAPFVDEHRCVLPGFLVSSERLATSMRAMESGEEERAKEIAREALEAADQIRNRC